MSQRSLPARDIAVELLVEAGAVLASSLDLATTMQQVAQLTVPRLADLCVIDLRDEDGVDQGRRGGRRRREARARRSRRCARATRSTPTASTRSRA